MTTPTLFLLDVFSLLFQVFHAIPAMTSPKGLPSNAAFGFTRDLLNILKTHRPTHWLCAMDSPGAGVRDEIYPEYKAHREEMPPDLRPQIELVQRIMAGFGIPPVQCEQWEADDVIATTTRLAVERGWDVRILTNDKDARQLLGPHVKLFNIRKQTWFDADDLLTDWGVRPEQAIDFQSLVGDSVDNVPGVPLVGPKKAAALLQQFGTLDEVLANADKVAGEKLKANLKQHADLARVSRQLVTLNQFLPLDLDWDAMRIGRVDVPRLSELFQEFGFRRFIDDVRALPSEQTLPQSVAPTDSTTNSTRSGTLFPESQRHWEIIDSGSKLPAFLERLQSRDDFCLDLAASGARAMTSDILGFAFCWDDDASVFIPHPFPASQLPAGATSVLDLLRPVLERPGLRWCNHDLKFDLMLLRQAGIQVRDWGIDPMIASYLLEAGARSHDLAALVEKYFLTRLPNAETVFGKTTPFAEQRSKPAGQLFADDSDTATEPGQACQTSDDPAALARIAEWSTERAEYGWRLAKLLDEELRREGLFDLYWNLERPLIGVLADMETAGIRVDVTELRRQSAELATRLSGLIAEIQQLAGHDFNIDSPKQLAKVLFDELALPVVKKLKTGPSTDQEVLEKLALVHPLPAKIIEHRQLSKLKGTYLDALPEMVNPRTGRIHASFHQAVAATGRLSSADPNLQNIPIRTPEGQRVRSAFVPCAFPLLHKEGPGGVSSKSVATSSSPPLAPPYEGVEIVQWKLVGADYSQIELRMLAHFCGDPVLCEAFANGTDIHTAVACEVFNVEPSAVTSEQRRAAKAVNFGVLYGQSAFGLAEALHIDQVEAALFIDQYFAKYAAVDEFITKTLADVARTGFATTIMGRRRAISGIRPERHRQLNLSERTAINTVIQGSAADLIKQAMIHVHRRLKRDAHPGRMLLQIHDELVCETPATEVESLEALVREEMQNAITLRVPLVVSVSSGDNWQQA